MLKGCAARFTEDAPRNPPQDPSRDSPQNSPRTLLRFALRVVLAGWAALACAPYIGADTGAPDSTEIFRDIVGLLGLP